MKKKIVLTIIGALGLGMVFTGCQQAAPEQVAETPQTTEANEGGEAAGASANEAAAQTGETETGETDAEEDTEGFEEDVEFTTEYGPISGGAEWGYNYEGSAVYLEGKTAVVTITVNSADDPFEEADLAKMRENAQKALDFISKSAADRGKKAEFAFNQDDLNFTYDYDDEVDSFEMDDYDGILEELVKSKIDAKAIKEKYNADGVLYMYLLNSAGDPFVTVHSVEDEEYFFNEVVGIYKESYNDDFDEVTTGPNVYAHMFLQAFGAVEIDPEYSDESVGYTDKLAAVVQSKYSNDVMASYLEEDGSINPDEVTKEITDITAYAVGLVDDFAELSANPEFKKENKGSFESKFDVSSLDDALVIDGEELPDDVVVVDGNESSGEAEIEPAEGADKAETESKAQ